MIRSAQIVQPQERETIVASDASGAVVRLAELLYGSGSRGKIVSFGTVTAAEVVERAFDVIGAGATRGATGCPSVLFCRRRSCLRGNLRPRP